MQVSLYGKGLVNSILAHVKKDVSETAVQVCTTISY